MAAFASTRTPPRGTRGGLVPATFALRIAPKSIVGQHLVRLFCFLAGQMESQGGLQLLLCFLLLTNSRKDHTEGVAVLRRVGFFLDAFLQQRHHRRKSLSGAIRTGNVTGRPEPANVSGTRCQVAA